MYEERAGDSKNNWLQFFKHDIPTNIVYNSKLQLSNFNKY